MEKSKKNRIHVLPIRVYLATGLTLFVLTGVTVAVSFVHLGAFNMVVAMTIASVKALLVLLFFMHLLYDNKLFLTIFAISVVFVALFIILTWFDTFRRGDLYPESAQPVQEQSILYQKPVEQTGEE